MKFSIQSNELVSALSKVIGVSPVRSTLPILGNFLFDLKGNELNILATDLEVYVNVKLDVEGKQDGQIAIPSKRLYDITQNLVDKSLTFEVMPQYKLIIKTKGGRWTITGEDANEFPMPAEIENTHTIEIKHEHLIRYLSKAIHAASTDELRRSMNGIYFEIMPAELKVVSTDGHRLVKIINKDFSYEGEKSSILVPVKTCNLITKLLKGDSEAEVKLELSNEYLKCSSGDITIISRLIDDTFPNYESVIPTDNEKKLKVDKEILAKAVKRSIIMSDQITNRTSFTVNEKDMKVRAANNEYGTDAEETIDCSYTENEEFEIAFNGRYLLDAINQFDSEDVIFDFSSPLKAAIIRPSEQYNGEDLMMLVMPVRNV